VSPGYASRQTAWWRVTSATAYQAGGETLGGVAAGGRAFSRSAKAGEEGEAALLVKKNSAAA